MASNCNENHSMKRVTNMEVFICPDTNPLQTRQKRKKEKNRL